MKKIEKIVVHKFDVLVSKWYFQFCVMKWKIIQSVTSP